MGVGLVLRALVTTLYRLKLANGLTCIAHSMQLATDFFLLPLSVVGPLEKNKKQLGIIKLVGVP